MQALGKTVPDAHEHAEAGMPRHGGHGAHERGGETVHENVADILPQREAQRHEDRVDDAVKLAVERGGVPRAALQQEVFCALLREGHDTEIHDDVIRDAVLREELPQNGAAEPLENERDERRGDPV